MSSVVEVETELWYIQSRLQADMQNTDLATTEQTLVKKVSQLQLQEEVEMAQHDKCAPPKEGDRCTKFFCGVVRM